MMSLEDCLAALALILGLALALYPVLSLEAPELASFSLAIEQPQLSFPLQYDAIVVQSGEPGELPRARFYVRPQ